MAEKFYREMSCDRCGRQISLTDSAPGETMSKDTRGEQKPVVSFSMEGEKLVEYKDLCDKCKKRCRDLLKMSAGEYKPKDKKKDVKPSETGKDKRAQPTV